VVAAMRLPRFDWSAPETLAAACAALAAAPTQTRVLAGGTDLLVKLKHSNPRSPGAEPAPQQLLSLSLLPELRGVSTQPDGSLRIGALCTMAELADHQLLLLLYPALAEGASVVGGPAIRNRATVGGNVVNARPCADTLPPLVVLGAHLQLHSLRGQRTIDVDGFVSGPGQTSIGRDEILTAITLPAPQPHSGSCYLKFTRRAAMEITVVGCAAFVRLDGSGATVEQARLCYTSVAPIPLRAPAAEALLIGHSPDAATLAAAALAAQQTAKPIDDHRAPAFLRSDVIAVLTQRALCTAVERARGAR